MKKKTCVVVSQCLLGVNCRYDGGSNPCPAMAQLMEKCHVVPVCPEMLGGMTTPRLPSERRGDQVVNRQGEDVTAHFEKGAEEALKIAQLYGAGYAVLKQSSPSCGSQRVYDGSFTGRKIPGQGVAAAMFEKAGIALFDEHQVMQLIEILEGVDDDTI